AGARASLLESSGAPAAARMLDSGRDVQAVALSPDHRLLAVAAADGTLRLWGLSRPGHPARVATVAELGRTHPLYAAAFSPDGKLLAAGRADDTVRLWHVADPAKPRLAAMLTGPAHAVDAVAFSPDGDELAAGSYDDRVWLWNITKPAKPMLARKLTGATDWIMAVAFSPDGNVLAASGRDGQLRLWDTATGVPLAVIPQPQPVTSLTWDGPHLVVTGDADGYARAWHLPAPDL